MNIENLAQLANIPLQVLLLAAIYLVWLQLRRVSDHMESILDKLLGKILEDDTEPRK
jgi:hypothetical protein